MVFQRLLARLNHSRKGDIENTHPPVPPRPRSQLGIRSSKSTPPTLKRRKSDGGATPEFPSASSHHFNAADVNEHKPVKLSSYIVDPTAAYENKSSRKSTLHASAELVIDVLKESSDVFTPLKSVASGLSALLKHYNQTMANRETIEALIPRIEGLAESLSVPAPDGEIKEIKRRQKLREKLEKALQDLELLAERGNFTGFLNNVKDAEILTGLAEDVRDAMIDYQTALQQDIFHKSQQLVDEAERSLLNAMRHTADAGYLFGNREGCLKGTRKEVLLHIGQWLMDEKDQRILWLNGLAGTGKSTIAQTFAEISFADGKLGASFFCSRDFEDRSNLQTIFPTLAFQLAYRYPQFREQLLQVLKTSPDVGRESLSSQLEKLIVRPFTATQIPTLIIIDALDECKDKEPASALLSVLARHVHEIPEVKFFITGRPEPPIREGFRLESLRPITDVLKLHDVKRSLVDDDIKLYLRAHLTDILKTRSDCEFPEGWPSSYDINILCKKTGGLFIYASTVVKFVASKYHRPTKRLDLIILRSQIASHEGGIDLLYTQILELAFQDADPDEKELYSDFRNVVGAVLLVFHPLSRKDLSNLLKYCGSPSNISTTLRLLHSLLNVPDSEDEPIRVFHKSFPDFLTDRTRCRDDRFLIDPAVHHEDILFSCLELMKKRLKKNICHLDDYTVLTKIKDLSSRSRIYIGNSLEYACRFWTRHLAGVPGDKPHVRRVREAIDEFFETRLLCWIEVLSIVGQLEAAVYAIDNIRQWYISTGISTCEQADDAERLILGYFDLIRDSPSHIYHSALPLSPSSSWIRKCYEAEVVGEVRVLMGLPDQWDTCSRTILLNNRPEAFAYWEGTIAVGFGSNVVLLDAITGITMSVLSGHRGSIPSLAFSLDGTLLISVCYDGTAKLWDIQTGGVIRTFVDDNSTVSAASISPDGTTIALGMEDGEIRLWDIRTWKCHSVERRQDSEVRVIKFSPIDSRRLLSSSQDTVWQWGVDGHQIGASFCEEGGVEDLACTLDGTRFVSCGEMVATVRDFESGAVVVKLHAPSGSSTLDTCCFSPDGRFIACAANESILIWDITISGARLVRHLVGHSNSIFFTAFPSSIISGSYDRSVKFWNSSSFSADSTTTDHTVTLDRSTRVMSAKLFAKDEIVVTSDSSGVVKTWDLTTGRFKSSFSTPAKGERDTHLVGDTLILVWCADEEKKYHIWDVYKGQILRTFHSSSSNILGLKISGDGSKIFVLSRKGIDAISMQTGEDAGRVELGRNEGFSFFVHGSKVRVDNSRGRGWDFGGPTVSELGEFLDSHRLRLVNQSVGRDVEKCWIEDTVTQRQLFRLPERYTKYGTKIEWDGRYLLLWSPSEEDVVIILFDPVCPPQV